MLGVDYVAMGWDDGGAIITLGFKCVQMTVGSRINTTGMVKGMTTINNLMFNYFICVWLLNLIGTDHNSKGDTQRIKVLFAAAHFVSFTCS